jgi:hypothetical protein
MDRLLDYEGVESALKAPLRCNEVMGVNAITGKLMRPDYWREPIEILTFDLTTIKEAAKGHTLHYSNNPLRGGRAASGFCICYDT